MILRIRPSFLITLWVHSCPQLLPCLSVPHPMAVSWHVTASHSPLSFQVFVHLILSAWNALPCTCPLPRHSHSFLYIRCSVTLLEKSFWFLETKQCASWISHSSMYFSFTVFTTHTVTWLSYHLFPIYIVEVLQEKEWSLSSLNLSSVSSKVADTQ